MQYSTTENTTIYKSLKPFENALRTRQDGQQGLKILNACINCKESGMCTMPVEIEHASELVCIEAHGRPMQTWKIESLIDFTIKPRFC